MAQPTYNNDESQPGTASQPRQTDQTDRQTRTLSNDLRKFIVNAINDDGSLTVTARPRFDKLREEAEREGEGEKEAVTRSANPR